MKGRKETVVIDGYNLIYYWYNKQLKEVSLEELRKELVEKLQEFQNYSGVKVILVFDAYKVRGMVKEENFDGLEVWFTKEGETADTLIEKMVYNLKQKRKRVTVVTSDYAQQQFVLGKGAIRKSSREFINDLLGVKAKIRNTITKNAEKVGNTIGGHLSPEKVKLLEKKFKNEKT
ncbi:NYN domain-containing protein [Proteinivorax hydrogeniformans]|uniref:NYN domain-containing protein n=1 Tax=Proteinivorax hydrogeniformans TaxID=1826727 RepID=A0AAU8HTH1_9FIRM